MNTPKDGGPAFPQPIHKLNFDTTPDDFDETGRGGMTLRDWFAAQATDEDIRQFTEVFKSQQGHGTFDLTSRTEARYKFADAMLKEREK